MLGRCRRRGETHGNPTNHVRQAPTRAGEEGQGGREARTAAGAWGRGRRRHDDDLDLAAEEQLTPGELLERIEAVHKRYEAKQISFEEFEEQKTDLLTRLSLLPIE